MTARIEFLNDLVLIRQPCRDRITFLEKGVNFDSHGEVRISEDGHNEFDMSLVPQMIKWVLINHALNRKITPNKDFGLT